jgi:hypothetical protein
MRELSKRGQGCFFLSALKNENEPIVIEYVPGKFQNYTMGIPPYLINLNITL